MPHQQLGHVPSMYRLRHPVSPTTFVVQIGRTKARDKPVIMFHAGPGQVDRCTSAEQQPTQTLSHVAGHQTHRATAHSNHERAWYYSTVLTGQFLDQSFEIWGSSRAVPGFTLPGLTTLFPQAQFPMHADQQHHEPWFCQRNFHMRKFEMACCSRVLENL